MKSAAVAHLKASLSEYLSKVKRGEEIIITDRGNPIAKIIPFQDPKGTSRKYLAKLGILELGTGKIDKIFIEPSPIKDPTDSILQYFLKEREEQN